MTTFQKILRYLLDRLTAPSAWASGSAIQLALQNIHDRGATEGTVMILGFAIVGVLFPSIPKFSVEAPLTPGAIQATNTVSVQSGSGGITNLQAKR